MQPIVFWQLLNCTAGYFTWLFLYLMVIFNLVKILRNVNKWLWLWLSVIYCLFNIVQHAVSPAWRHPTKQTLLLATMVNGQTDVNRFIVIPSCISVSLQINHWCDINAVARKLYTEWVNIPDIINVLCFREVGGLNLSRRT
jgi:hypothetical protein